MSEGEVKHISVTLTELFSETLDRLVAEGVYVTPQAAIRDALRRLFRFHGVESFS